MDDDRGLGRLREIIKTAARRSDTTTEERESKEPAMQGDDKKNPKIGSIHVEKIGTLIVGDDISIETNAGEIHEGSATTISAKQALEIDTLVKEIAAGRQTEAESVWEELCGALEIPDSKFITKENYGAASKLLSAWKERVVRDAVNQATKR